MNTLPHFKCYQKSDVLAMTKIRKFETKIGERVRVAENLQELPTMLQDPSIKFVLFGIPEDMGVTAHDGLAGANSVWNPFLSAFLNIQSNDFLDGDQVLVLGHFDFSDIKTLIDHHAHDPVELIDAYRHALITIDDEVEALTKLICRSAKLPVVIGGGQNNAYPLIKGAAKGWHKAEKIPMAQINAINLDAHCDYKPAEGRHHHNGFRYAEEDGYLLKYCVVAVHENNISQNVWMDLVNNPFMDIITYEDIFLHEKRNFIQALAHATGFTEDNYTGIELDMGAIADVLSTDGSPAGISFLQARQYMNFTALDTKAAYLHIAEGASKLSNGRFDEEAGMRIAYLVSDFIKSSIS